MAYPPSHNDSQTHLLPNGVHPALRDPTPRPSTDPRAPPYSAADYAPPPPGYTPTVSSTHAPRYASEEAYLAALRQWAHEKQFYHPADTGLVGFYGKTTLEEYAARPGLSLRSKLKARRATVAEGAGSPHVDDSVVPVPDEERGRRATVDHGAVHVDADVDAGKRRKSSVLDGLLHRKRGS